LEKGYDFTITAVLTLPPKVGIRRFLEKNLPFKALVPLLFVGMPWLKLRFPTEGEG
jgi:hypothetical protein